MQWQADVVVAEVRGAKLVRNSIRGARERGEIQLTTPPNQENISANRDRQHGRYEEKYAVSVE